MLKHDIEIIDHTADIGIRLSRATLEALFRDAAFGMFRLIAPESQFQSKIERQIVVHGDDMEQLLVAWLSELNFLFQTELFAPALIDMSIDGELLQATVRGETANRQEHNIEIEIKAVTFHKIYVEKKKGLWRAQVIFDI